MTAEMAAPERAAPRHLGGIEGKGGKGLGRIGDRNMSGKHESSVAGMRGEIYNGMGARTSRSFMTV